MCHQVSVNGRKAEKGFHQSILTYIKPMSGFPRSIEKVLYFKIVFQDLEKVEFGQNVY